jgi:DNA-binding PadR family transcriptional regulator
MGLRHAVLAALLEGEASGYELAKRFDVTVAEFWSATPQQLYRDLEQMESAGLVRARVVEQERRPTKRVFALTDAGRAELRAFTATTAKPGAMRDDLVVQLQAVDDGDAAAVRAGFRARRDQSLDKLARYEKMRARMLAGRTEEEFLASADRIGPYLTLLGGRLYEQQNIAWSETVMAVLAARAKGGATEGRKDAVTEGSSAPGGMLE